MHAAKQNGFERSKWWSDKEVWSMQPLCDFPSWCGLKMGGAKHMIKKKQYTWPLTLIEAYCISHLSPYTKPHL